MSKYTKFGNKGPSKKDVLIIAFLTILFVSSIY